MQSQAIRPGAGASWDSDAQQTPLAAVQTTASSALLDLEVSRLEGAWGRQREATGLASSTTAMEARGVRSGSSSVAVQLWGFRWLSGSPFAPLGNGQGKLPWSHGDQMRPWRSVGVGKSRANITVGISYFGEIRKLK